MGTIKQVTKEITFNMKILGRKILDKLKQEHADVCSQVDAWEAEATAACWCKPLDIKNRYATASILPNNYVIFNLILYNQYQSLRFLWFLLCLLLFGSRFLHVHRILLD